MESELHNFFDKLCETKCLNGTGNEIPKGNGNWNPSEWMQTLISTGVGHLP